MNRLRNNIIKVFFSVVLCLSLSGCWPLILGGVAAVGGYAVSRDTIQGESSAGFNELWDASKDVASVMGTITSESFELGEIKALINGTRTTITVLPLTTTTVRLKVKSRKMIFPSIANAQDVFIEIMNEVKDVKGDL